MLLPQVYNQLQPQAYFLKLANGGAGLQAAWEAFSKMEEAISVLNWYYALNGISILLLIARCAEAAFEGCSQCASIQWWCATVNAVVEAGSSKLVFFCQDSTTSALSLQALQIDLMKQVAPSTLACL